jgi:hypothetical protein
MKKPIEKIATYRCVDLDVSGLEETKSVNWISRTQRGIVYTIKGVPSSDLDILIVPEQECMVRVLDLGLKVGKYGGNRHRITVRNVPLHQAYGLSCVAVWFELSDANAVIHIGDDAYTFGRYRTDLDSSSNLEKIIRWHYSRYYRMLSENDVRATEVEFRDIVESSSMTLAEANRLASRLLYRVARRCGYRKLTLREQRKLGLSGQWHSEAEYAAAHNRIQSSKYSPTGASEYSLRAANLAL